MFNSSPDKVPPQAWEVPILPWKAIAIKGSDVFPHQLQRRISIPYQVEEVISLRVLYNSINSIQIFKQTLEPHSITILSLIVTEEATLLLLEALGKTLLKRKSSSSLKVVKSRGHRERELSEISKWSRSKARVVEVHWFKKICLSIVVNSSKI